MHAAILLVFVLVAISPAPSAPPPSGGRNQRGGASDTSDRLIFAADSTEDDLQPAASGGNSRAGRSTTTLGPAMTFRGRAPSRSRVADEVPPTPTTPPTSTAAPNWRRRMQTAVPNFMNRVGQFFGRKTTTAPVVTTTTEATRPLIETGDGDPDDGLARSGNETEIDIRVIIDAPSIGGCPDGTRMQSGRCRRIHS